MQYIDEKDNAFLVRRRAALSARPRNVNCDASHVAGGWERMSTPRLSQSKQVRFDSFGGRGAFRHPSAFVTTVAALSVS